MKTFITFWVGFIAGMVFMTYGITSAFAADVELYGETLIGTLRFSDGTTQSTANVPGIPGPQGPQGPQGIQGPPGEPAPVAPARILYINRLSISEFLPVWFTQGKNWQSFSPDFGVTFTKLTDLSILRVMWSDNIGIYNNSWCNIGIFLDDQPTTSCSGSWSGIYGTTIFNQQSVNCILESVPAGSHTLHVRHRSQYCVYGNYAFDAEGSYRLISVEEQN